MTMEDEGGASFAIFLFILIITGCAEGAAPTLNVPDVWVFEISATEANHSVSPLSINCVGDRKLTWNTKVSEQYYKIQSNVTGGKYYSTLSIQEPYPEDTGYFNCTNHAGHTAFTYVYIYDGVQGFVSAGTHHPITVEIGASILLDCRTTHPDIKVTVFKDNKEDVTNRFRTDAFYRFSKTAESLQETGIYTCKESKFLSEKTLLVNIKPRQNLQKPSIEKHRNFYPVVGVDFSLNCSVPVDKNDHPEISWETPNPNVNSKTTRWDGENLATSMLQVRSPTWDDSGDYRCIVKQGDYVVKDVTYIKVEDSVTPFVKFDVLNDTKHRALFVKERNKFQWVMYFKGFPQQLKYTFYDPFKRPLKDKDGKVVTSYVYEDGKLSLEMYDVTAQEFGNYSVRLEAPNGDYDENFVILVVNATPKVEFGAIPSLSSPSKAISITAHILAFTLTQQRPKVSWWYYSDCFDGIGSCDERNGRALEHSLDKDTGPLNRYKSKVDFKPLISGLILCKVENDFGINSTKVHLFVSDKAAKFLVRISTEDGVMDITKQKSKTIEVVEEDRVIVECSALKFLYKDLHLSSNESFTCNTELSSGRCLQKQSIGIGESNSYGCVTWNKDTEEKEIISFHISVLEKLEPNILPGSNVSIDGTVISVKSSDPFAIACYVEGRPTPEITWLKDGVNIEEIPNYVDNRERVFLSEDRQLLEFKFAQKEYEGKYECRIRNRIGEIRPYASVVVQGVGLSTVHYVGIGIAATLFIFLCFVVLFLIFRIKKESKLRNELRQNRLYLFEKGNVGDLNKECTIDEQADLLPYDPDFEVPRENIKLGKQLGTGAFGRVMLAEVDGLDSEGRSSTRVAVKMCKDAADMAHLRALTLELKIMVHLGKHLNIVNLIGAHTSNMNKGELWILVEYCKYGNLLKFIQRCKSRFVNQIDPISDVIDIHRMTPIPDDPLSPTSLGRSSTGFGKYPNLDTDGYLQARPRGESIQSGRSVGRQSSAASRTESVSGASRPGLYVGNPHYATAGVLQEATSPAISPPEVGSVDNYVLAAHLSSPPYTPRDESSSPSSEGGYHMTLNTEMTTVSSPPPFSPSSTTSDFFFDSQGNPVTFDSGGTPGVSAPFTTTDLICWAWQVANGMEYLTKRKVLHGDLAARNLLLAENNVVKISDFGFSRDMYKNDVYMKKGDEIMPIKWMAPEAIQQKVFSIQSDVWAYGITLWEMFTLGNTPYPGVPLNQEFTIALENGMRMEKPKYCNENIFNLMMDCWRLNPMDRPSFSQITNLLSEMLSPESRESYVKMNTVYMAKNEEWMGRHEDYLTMVTSPDFKNLHSPIEEVGGDQSYIPMQTMMDAVSGEGSQRPGYLDMRSVRSDPNSLDVIFSPRPLDADKDEGDTVFNFSDNETALSGDLQSPAETSSLLDKPGGGPPVGKNKSPNAVRNHNNNNNINKLNSLQQQPLYQNLEKVALPDRTDPHESIARSLDASDDDDEEGGSRPHYVNALGPTGHYVNASKVVS